MMSGAEQNTLWGFDRDAKFLQPPIFQLIFYLHILNCHYLVIMIEQPGCWDSLSAFVIAKIAFEDTLPKLASKS